MLKNSHAGTSSTYDFSWLDPDKEVYVLQNRKFKKSGTFHAAVGGGLTLSGPFMDGQAIQAKAGYFFHEEWGVQFVYSKNFGEENDTFDSVRNIGGPGSTPFIRDVKSYMGGMVFWSPFYAKINTFNKILYVDWIIGLGAAKLDDSNNKEIVNNGGNSGEWADESHTGLMWGMGLKFYLTSMFHIRLDLITIHYKATKGLTDEEGFYSNYDLGLLFGMNI